tara:strand:- start:366 stop:563 length:198 start_codon:yes stop_codon:yes gene_type:complete
MIVFLGGKKMRTDKKKRMMYMGGMEVTPMKRKPMMVGGAVRQGGSGSQPVYGGTVADAMPKGSAN